MFTKDAFSICDEGKSLRKDCFQSRWFGVEKFVTLVPDSFSGRLMDEQVMSNLTRAYQSGSS